LHEVIARFYWALGDEISNVKAIAVDDSELLVFVDSSRTQLVSRLKKQGADIKPLRLNVKSEADLRKYSDKTGVHVLYDPNMIFSIKKRGDASEKV
jgi:hypothetical protein